MIKRTEGISTTDLVGRMLMCKMRPVSKSSAPTEMHADFSQQRGAHAADGEPSREAGPSSAADAAASLN